MKLFKYIAPERTGFYQNYVCKIPSNKCEQVLGRENLIDGFFPNLELVASTPGRLNDPFECKVDVKIDRKAYFRSMLEDPNSCIKYFHNNYDRKIKNKTDLKQFVRQLKKVSISKMFKIHCDAVENSNETLMAIVSFSIEPDNILMWSHYCKNHSGIVIEFDLPSSHEYEFKEVEYVETLPQRKLNHFKNSAYPTEAFYSKFNIWNYEKEVRMILKRPEHLDRNEIFKYKFSADSIKSIRFGALINDNLMNDIIHLCGEKYPHIRLLKMAVCNDKYALIERNI